MAKDTIYEKEGSFEHSQSYYWSDELFAKVVEAFPYPIRIYDADGVGVYANKAMSSECLTGDSDTISGKNDIFMDPYIVASGKTDDIKRVFQGETVYFTDVKVPFERITRQYGIQCFDIEAVYQDITVFPILENNAYIKYIALLLVNRKIYSGKNEIEKSKQYIREHWQEGFNLKETAKVSGFSNAHFRKLFKIHTGGTAHDYFVNYKISKLKDMLSNTSLSISEALVCCNIDYCGHSIRLFKNKIGCSPSEYRNMLKAIQNESAFAKEQIDDDNYKINCFLSEQEHMLSNVIIRFPYPLQIFSPDGFSRMINKSALDMIGIKSIETHIGIYNVFDDNIVRELGFMENVRQVLSGKVVNITDFNAPYKGIMRYMNVVEWDIQTINSDITCFPLLNEEGCTECFVAVFMFKKVFRGREEIERGKQYIDKHWMEGFDMFEIAKAACLSKAHFAKLFKQHTGITPYEYYTDIRIEKLKEKLRDPNYSVSQAFEECKMNYNGHLAGVFKDKVGLSPLAFKQKYK